MSIPIGRVNAPEHVSGDYDALPATVRLSMNSLFPLLAQVVDSTWSRTPDATSSSNLWFVPIALMILIAAAFVVTKRPWILLALIFALVVVVPMGSCITR